MIVKKNTPKAIPIESPTHPDQNKWYQNNSPVFSWQLSPEIEKIAFSLDQKPSGVSSLIVRELVTSYQYQNLKEGIWYFHFQGKNQDGWGEVSHFRIQIDQTPPEPFTFEIDNNGDPTNPQPFLILEAKDNLSGIDFYEIKIGESTYLVKAQDLKDNRWQIPITPYGEYLVSVTAFDKANNSRSAEPKKLKIEPLEPPIFTEYPEKINFGEPLIIKGISKIPAREVNIYIANKSINFFDTDSISLLKDNSFKFFYEKKLKPGIYTFWAEVVDERGARSVPSEKIRIEVQMPLALYFKKIVLGHLLEIILLIIIVLETSYIIKLKRILKRKRRNSNHKREKNNKKD